MSTPKPDLTYVLSSALAAEHAKLSSQALIVQDMPNCVNEIATGLLFAFAHAIYHQNEPLKTLEAVQDLHKYIQSKSLEDDAPDFVSINESLRDLLENPQAHKEEINSLIAAMLSTQSN